MIEKKFQCVVMVGIVVGADVTSGNVRQESCFNPEMLGDLKVENGTSLY